MTGARGVADILHVDMDAFFAAVEVLDAPELAGRPVVVGGTGSRGVVASCSYEARAYGVRSAMPTAQARALCPSAVFISGRYGRYVEVSHHLHEVLGAFTPVVEGIALDEAFLDVAGAHSLFGDSEAIAWALRRQVRHDLNLDCSVGVATSKMVAKLASEQAKPHARLGATEPGAGVVVVEPGAELDFLWPLPVRSLWGVGPATAKRLSRFGVSSISDLAAVPASSLVNALGPSAGRRLHDLAWARDDRAVVAARATKSIGHEETFASDEYELEVLHRQVVRMADAVGQRLKANALVGRTVILKARYADFATVTRSATQASLTDAGHEIARVASGLLAKVEIGRGIRLLGVSVSGLQPRQHQVEATLSFDDLDQLEPGRNPPPEAQDSRRRASWAEATDAVDAVRQRFGLGAVSPATLVEGHRVRVKVQGDAQWGPSSPRPDETSRPQSPR